MSSVCKIAKRSERGTALLIAVFALMLIAGVAMSLILMAGTESAIAGNYRTSTQAFYASYAGLEEARGRMWPGHPNSIAASVPIPLPVNRVVYIVNPSAGEAVQPNVLNSTNRYADTQYQQEFGTPITGAVVTSLASESPVGALGMPGPMYKWVRLTAKTEASSGIDVNGDGALDNALPIFYDGTSQNLLGSGRQVLRVTSLSMLPNGSRRLLQYEIAPVTFNLSFPAALTFDGQGAALFPANSNVYTVKGADSASCGTPAQGARPAIGVVTPGDDVNITNSIPANRLNKYTGSGPAPDVQNIAASMPPAFQDVPSLESTVSAIRSSADYVVTGPATSLPALGTQAAPVTIVVDGDLTLSGDETGYGILVVTGNYIASGTVGWRGIVLVIGQGYMEVNGGGNNSYEGAVLLARTRDAAGNLLANPGATVLDWAGGGGNGVHYDSCHVNNAQNNVVYRILSFREIVQ